MKLYIFFPKTYSRLVWRSVPGGVLDKRLTGRCPENAIIFKRFRNFRWKCMPGSGIFFHFTVFLSIFLEKVSYNHTVTDLKTRYSIYCVFRRIVQDKVHRKGHICELNMENNTLFRNFWQKFQPGSGIFVEKWYPKTGHIPYGLIWKYPPPPGVQFSRNKDDIEFYLDYLNCYHSGASLIGGDIGLLDSGPKQSWTISPLTLLEPGFFGAWKPGGGSIWPALHIS